MIEDVPETKKICERCKHEILGTDYHIALPDGAKKLCWVIINLLEEAPK